MMKILEKQVYHLIVLCILLLGVFVVARGDVLTGTLWGISTRSWLWLSILVPVIHQFYVVILWRAELYYQSLSKYFGEHDFLFWSVGFLLLLGARPILVICLALANRHTLLLPAWIAWFISVVCLGLVIYLGYSVLRFFGLKRAMGLDHFYPDEYKNLPMVKEGIFRWTPNPMYVFGFLILWIPGLLLFSKAALLAAAFNHLYIWAHYYFTEKPDMNYIYQSN
jgi:hypothetical protein